MSALIRDKADTNNANNSILNNNSGFFCFFLNFIAQFHFTIDLPLSQQTVPGIGSVTITERID